MVVSWLEIRSFLHSIVFYNPLDCSNSTFLFSWENFKCSLHGCLFLICVSTKWHECTITLMDISNIWRSWRFFLWIFTILSHNILDGIESSIIPFFLAMCHLRKWFVLKQCLMIMHFFCQYLFLDVVIGFNVRNRASKCGSTFVCFSINNSLLHWICNEVSYTNKNTTIRILVRSLGKWLFANVFEGSQCLLFTMENLLSWHEVFIVPSNRLIATFGE